MKLSEVCDILGAEVILSGVPMDYEVESACGADLMSDVLAFVKEKCLLLTGLSNQHVIRTADMVNISCVVFVRGKTPEEETLNLARKFGMTLLRTDKTLYEACGMLYVRGLMPVPR